MADLATENWLKVVRAAIAAGLPSKKAKEIAERSFGIPERCGYQGIEGDRCTRIAGHEGYHEWQLQFDGETTLTTKEEE